MAINGRILGVKKDYFPLNFMEYMKKEELEWLQCKVRFLHWCDHFGWVFWSQQDHEIEPSLCLDNFGDFNPNVCAIPKVRDNIRHALQNLILASQLNGCLVQFWAPTTTSEGRTKLTTEYQPFALGPTYSTIQRQWLCEYRMKMGREYKFYADPETGEEQLGLLGRVFRHKSPECTPDVKYYSTKEYPQRNLALQCEINGSWAVPVFDHPSQTCVGVLEMVSLLNRSSVWHDESFLRYMDDSFQEVGLQCFGGYKICEMQSRETIKRNKGLTAAFQELNGVLRSVCETHELPLAMTWVPCTACNGLLRGQLWSMDGFSTGVEFCEHINSPLTDFLKIGKCSHLRKGLVARRALSSTNMLYCSDITQLSVDDYPLVPYARQNELSGWFTICLLNVFTGNYIYVLEFFLSARSKDDENIRTKLSFILGTMEEKFETFRLASGKELGELMPFEVIYFQDDQKIPPVQFIQATRSFSSLSTDPSSVQSSSSSIKLIQATRNFSSMSSDPSSTQSSAVVANTSPGFQNANMVSIKAKYAHYMIRFKLPLPCRLVELQQKVAKRLQLEVGTYHIHYEDELAELILIACDEDLQACVNTSISLGKTSSLVFLKPK